MARWLWREELATKFKKFFNSLNGGTLTICHWSKLTSLTPQTHMVSQSLANFKDKLLTHYHWCYMKKRTSSCPLAMVHVAHTHINAREKWKLKKIIINCKENRLRLVCSGNESRDESDISLRPWWIPNQWTSLRIICKLFFSVFHLSYSFL